MPRCVERISSSTEVTLTQRSLISKDMNSFKDELTRVVGIVFEMKQHEQIKMHINFLEVKRIM